MNSTRKLVGLGASGIAAASLLALGAGPALAASTTGPTLTLVGNAANISPAKTVTLAYTGVNVQQSVTVLLDGNPLASSVSQSPPAGTMQTNALFAGGSAEHKSWDEATIPADLAAGWHTIEFKAKDDQGKSDDWTEKFHSGGGHDEPIGAAAGGLGAAGLLGVGLFALNRRRRGALL